MSLDPARCCIRRHGMLTKKTTVLATLRRRALLRVAVSGNSHSTTQRLGSSSTKVANHEPSSMRAPFWHSQSHSRPQSTCPCGEITITSSAVRGDLVLAHRMDRVASQTAAKVSTFGCTRRAYLQRERRLGRVAARLVRERLHEAVEGRHRAGDAPEGAAGALLI